MKLSLSPIALVIALTLAACSQQEDARLAPSAAPAPAAAPPSAVPGEAAAPAGAAAAAVPAPAGAPSPAPAAATAKDTPNAVAAAPAKDQASKPSSSHAAGGLAVKRLVLASRVVEREPEVVLEPKVNEPLLAFVEAKNDKADEERLIVTFEHESGTKVGFVELSVPGGAKRWRTWARTKNVKEVGNWAAVVRTADGQELSRTAFIVSEG